MGKTNYLLLLSIVFMLLMASQEKKDTIKPNIPTRTHGSAGTSTAGQTSAKLN